MDTSYELTENRSGEVTLPGPGTELKPERVQELLQALPGWQLSARGKAIERIAEDGRVLVTLSAPRGAGGLTEAVFNLARQIG